MKLKNFINRIPRPVRACACALCVVVLAAVYYIVLGCPTLTLEQEFRRAEKAHMVGPSVIVDTTRKEYTEFEKMIVGETEQGICFFGRYGSSYSGGKHSGERHYLFRHLEKTGDLTIAAAPNVWATTWVWEVQEPKASIPVYLFAEHPDAVRAEIEVTVQGSHDSTNSTVCNFQESFHAEAERSDSGVFRFFFQSKGVDATYALQYLSDIASNSILSSQEREAVVLAKVWLYGENGNLLETRDLTIHGNPEGTTPSN